MKYEEIYKELYEEETISHRISQLMEISNALVEDILEMSWDLDQFYRLDESQIRHLLAKYSNKLNEHLHCKMLSEECLLSFARYVQDERTAADFAQRYYLIQRDYFVHNFVDKAIELAEKL